MKLHTDCTAAPAAKIMLIVEEREWHVSRSWPLRCTLDRTITDGELGFTVRWIPGAHRRIRVNDLWFEAPAGGVNVYEAIQMLREWLNAWPADAYPPLLADFDERRAALMVGLREHLGAHSRVAS